MRIKLAIGVERSGEIPSRVPASNILQRREIRNDL